MSASPFVLSPVIHTSDRATYRDSISPVGFQRNGCHCSHRRTSSTGRQAQRATTIATASLETELAQLRAEIAAFVSMPPERTSTLTRRLEAFAALRERAKLYRSVLAITVTDLDRQLDEMSATVEGMINKKAA